MEEGRERVFVVMTHMHARVKSCWKKKGLACERVASPRGRDSHSPGRTVPEAPSRGAAAPPRPGRDPREARAPKRRQPSCVSIGMKVTPCVTGAYVLFPLFLPKMDPPLSYKYVLVL